MKRFVTVAVILVCSASALAGQNPDINIFLRFEDGSNTIHPAPFQPFDVYVCFENFGPGGGLKGASFKFNRTFNASKLSQTVLLPSGVGIGDVEVDGWSIAGIECAYPDVDGVVVAASVQYREMGGPGVLEIVDHPVDGRAAVDCNQVVDEWCVRREPSGHAGVAESPPAGDCPAAPVTRLVPSQYATIQGAVDASAAGDTVLVAPGTYATSTNGEQFPIVMSPGVKVIGEEGPSVTIVDAELGESVFECDFDGEEMYLEGFFITKSGGNGPALFCDQVTGGMVNECIFEGNQAQAGGAIAVYLSTLDILSCTFTENTATVSSGGAIYAEDSDVFCSRCLFEENDGGLGGALSLAGSANGILNQSTVVRNMTHAIYVGDGATLILVYSIVAFNGKAAVRCADLGVAEAFSTDIYWNFSGIGDWIDCLEDYENIDDNFSADPMFCDFEGGDFHVSTNSLCAEGNNPHGQIGAFGSGCTQPCSWSGEGDGISWGDPGNWWNGVLPGPGDPVEITQDGTYTVILDVDASIQDLTVGGGSASATLELNAGLDILGAGQNDGLIRLTETGRLTVAEGATLDIGVGGELDNQAVEDGCALEIAGDVSVAAGGTLRNRGWAQVEATARLDISGDLINEPKESIKCLNIHGRVNVLPGAQAVNEYIVRFYGTGSLVNQGVFDHRENALIEGSGTFDSSGGVFLGGGIIRPGLDGPLTFMGDLVQLSTGEIKVDIGGGDPGYDHGQLVVEGSITYDGAVSIGLVDGFEPGLGQIFDVIHVFEPMAKGWQAAGEGDFYCQAGLELPNDLYFDPVVSPDGYQLVVTDQSTGNQAPLGLADTYTVYGETAMTLDVLINDTDPDDDDLRLIDVIQGGVNGLAWIDQGVATLSYLPAEGYYGPASFDYVITDCAGGTDTVSVALNMVSGVEDPEFPEIPGVTLLGQNFPNPFNPVTTIRFTLHDQCRAKLAVYTLDGRRVATLLDEVLQPARHEAVWDAVDEQGRLLPSGVYFYRLEAGEYVETKRMILLK